MTLEVRPLVEINQQALRLLYQELGITDTVRFLRQFTTGFGDYTKEREVLFARKTLPEIIGEMEKQPENPSNPA